MCIRDKDVVVSVEPAGDPSADDVPLEEPDEVIEDGKDLDAASVTAFVQRLYRVCMGREADASGLNTWVTGLLYGGQTGASVAHGFFDSKEYKAMNLSLIHISCSTALMRARASRPYSRIR